MNALNLHLCYETLNSVKLQLGGCNVLPGTADGLSSELTCEHFDKIFFSRNIRRFCVEHCEPEDSIRNRRAVYNSRIVQFAQFEVSAVLTNVVHFIADCIKHDQIRIVYYNWSKCCQKHIKSPSCVRGQQSEITRFLVVSAGSELETLFCRWQCHNYRLSIAYHGGALNRRWRKNGSEIKW